MGEAGAGGFFRGTNIDQDGRFSNKEEKLLKEMVFPSCFSQKVKIEKVNIDVIKQWVAKRVTELLGVDDDITVGYVFAQLTEKDCNPKKIQLQLTPMLDKDTPIFMEQLWNLLLEAQSSIDGIPHSLVVQKKEELLLKSKQQQNQNNSTPQQSTVDLKPKEEHSHHRSNRHHHKHKHKDQEVENRNKEKKHKHSSSSSRSKSRSPKPHSHSHSHRNRSRSPNHSKTERH